MACSREEVEFHHHGQLASSKVDKGMDECDRADAWFGRYLVKTVNDSLVELSEKNKVEAWGANNAVVKDRKFES